MSIKKFLSKPGGCEGVECDERSLVEYHPEPLPKFKAETHLTYYDDEPDKSYIRMSVNDVWSEVITLTIAKLKFRYNRALDRLEAVPKNENVNGWNLVFWTIHLENRTKPDGSQYEVFVDTLSWSKVSEEVLLNMVNKSQGLKPEKLNRSLLLNDIFTKEISAQIAIGEEPIKSIDTKWIWIKRPD